MSISAQLTSEQLKEIIEDEKNRDKGARAVQEQVEDAEEVPDPENTSSVQNMVHNIINNEFDACSIRQSPHDRIPGHKYLIPGLRRCKVLAHQVWGLWFILRRRVLDADKPGVLVADEMGLGNTFTSAAAAMLCKLVTEKVVMGLPLSILWGNTLEEWMILAQNDFPGIVGKEWEWYPLLGLNSVPCRLLQIQSTPPPWASSTDLSP